MTANIHTSTRLQLPSPPLSQAFHVSELQWPVGYCRWWWCVTTGKEEATISSKLTWSKLMVAVKALEANASWININKLNKCTVELITVIRTHKMVHGISALYRTHTTCRSLVQIPNGHLCSKRGERQNARYNEGLHLALPRDLHLWPTMEYRECPHCQACHYWQDYLLARNLHLLQGFQTTLCPALRQELGPDLKELGDVDAQNEIIEIIDVFCPHNEIIEI